MRLKWQDSLAVVGVVLSVAGIRLDDTSFVISCLIGSIILICFSIFSHKEVKFYKRTIVAVIVTAFFGIVIVWTRNDAIAKELVKNSAPLEMANEQTPLSNCSIGQNAIAIFLGDSAVTSASSFPHTIVQFHKEPMLWFDRKDEELLLNFRIFDENGEIIARMSQTVEGPNTYWVRPDIRILRQNVSSLSVFDRRDKMVLDVHYLNYYCIKLVGTFRDPRDPSRAMIVADNFVATPPINFFPLPNKQTCFTENGMDFDF